MVEASVLNPDITTVDVGKKEMKSVILYPLSMGDQFKTTSMITTVVQEIMDKVSSGSKLEDLAFMAVIIENLRLNIVTILAMITDLSKEECDDLVQNYITNPQLVNIVNIVWTVNYEPAIKNGQSLFDRAKSLLQSKRSSEISLASTPSID